MATAKKSRDRVQEAVDAVKRFQDASDAEYDYSKKHIFGPEYGFKKLVQDSTNSARNDMQRKAAAAELVGATRDFTDRTKAKQTDMDMTPEKEAALVRKQRDADMDRKMREAADRFKRSNENDTPGYKKGGRVKKYARGGGIESKGKTRGSTVKMCRGGGIESRGKTRGRFV